MAMLRLGRPEEVGFLVEDAEDLGVQSLIRIFGSHASYAVVPYPARIYLLLPM